MQFLGSQWLRWSTQSPHQTALLWQPVPASRWPQCGYRYRQMYVRTHMSESLGCAYVLIVNTTALLLARLYYTYVHNHISVAQTPVCEHVYIWRMCVRMCVCMYVCTRNYIHMYTHFVHRHQQTKAGVRLYIYSFWHDQHHIFSIIHKWL